MILLLLNYQIYQDLITLIFIEREIPYFRIILPEKVQLLKSWFRVRVRNFNIESLTRKLIKTLKDRININIMLLELKRKIKSFKKLFVFLILFHYL